eukprot:2293268-Rhodomonas_salina.1
MERHTHGTYAARRGQLGWESEAASLSMATAKGECKGECVTECIGPRCAPEGRTAAPGLRLPLWGRRAPGIRWAADPNTESRLNLAEPDMLAAAGARRQHSILRGRPSVVVPLETQCGGPGDVTGIVPDRA